MLLRHQKHFKTYFKSPKTDSGLLFANHAYYVLKRDALEKGKPLSEGKTNEDGGRLKRILTKLTLDTL